MASAQTPLMQQYLNIKSEYQDCILFFRLGDFYEMFFEDAQKAAPILDIALTCRDKKATQPVPLCGVPHHSANTYIAKLLDQGLNVAICEQLEDASAQKGLVKRDVVRVITPSMRTENEGLSPTQTSPIAAIFPFSQTRNTVQYAFAWMDMAGGNLSSSVFNTLTDLENEIWKLNVQELVLPNTQLPHELMAWKTAYASIQKKCSFYNLDAWVFEDGEKHLCEQFDLNNLHGLGFQAPIAQAASCYALIHYAQDIRKNNCAHIDPPKHYHTHDCMHLDKVSQHHLDLFPSNFSQQHDLYTLLNQTQSKAGARALYTWMNTPLKNQAAIHARMNAVGCLLKNREQHRKIQSILKQSCDFERLSSKLIQRSIKPQELSAILQSLESVPSLVSCLQHLDCANTKDNLIADSIQNINPHQALQTLLKQRLEDNPSNSMDDAWVIKQGFHPQLDHLRGLCTDGQSWLNELEQKERHATGINTLKIRYNKVFGYYIEVTKSHIGKVPARFTRKQTLVNAERFITEELKNYEVQLLNAQDQRLQLEQQLYQELLTELAVFAKDLKILSRHLSQLDVLCAFAHVAHEHDYVRPQLNESSQTLAIEHGRHPMLEKNLNTQSFVPNDLELNHDQQQMIILTGPNMSGKSTIMRQTALIVYMAHLGSFVPATSAQIPIVDQIFTRVGTGDDLAQGRSTFMVEMNETAKILRNATQDSLIILDEVGRGTSTYDGLALAWAVAEYIHDHLGAKTLFATHYHELTELPDLKAKMQNFHVQAKLWEDKIIFMHTLHPGAASQSYGLEVAKMAGVLPAVLQSAKTILHNLETQHIPFGQHHAHPIVKTEPTPQVSALEKALDQLNLNELSPKQALDTLYTWKHQFSNQTPKSSA